MQFFWHIVAYHCRGLRIVLRETLHYFDDADQVCGFSGFMFQCDRIKNCDARGARVELNRVASVLDFGIAIIVVKEKFVRDGLQCLMNDLPWDLYDQKFSLPF